MRWRGFYRQMPEADRPGAGLPDPDPEPADAVPEPVPGAGDAPSDDASELDIEKRWLQLAAVDPDQFDHFYDKYHDRIFAFAFWRTGDEDAATDVTAETFLTAWEKRGQFRWRGYTFGAWLFQIARSVISRRQRRSRIERDTTYDADRHDVVVTDTPETEWETRRENALVSACLGQLTDGQREVIVLHHFVGLSVRQIAHVTEWPQGTVNSHLRRGKEALRRCLERHGAAHGLSEAAMRMIRRAALETSDLHVVERKDDDG
jgi:RNA polymerase sigma factor (sigma-70 family)